MLKVGDKVTVTDRFLSIEVGEVKEIHDIDSRGWLNLGGACWFNYKCFKKVEDNMFTKDMLVPGTHVVEQRNGELALIISGSLIYLNGNEFNPLGWWKEKLKSGFDETQDIVKVYEIEFPRGLESYKSLEGLRLVWTRQEKTQKQIDMEKLGEQIKEMQAQYDKMSEASGE